MFSNSLATIGRNRPYFFLWPMCTYRAQLLKIIFIRFTFKCILIMDSANIMIYVDFMALSESVHDTYSYFYIMKML